MTTIQACRFALDLTPGQQRDVLAHAGAARVAHNWALAKVKAVMDQRAAERSYGVSATVRRDGGRWHVSPRSTWPRSRRSSTPPGMARWQHVEPTARPAYAGRWR